MADGARGGGARGRDPSTIYRRWGDLSQLLADVAVEQLQPEQAPPDTGSFYGDLLAWLEQYFDEMSSVPGRALLRDVLGTPGHEGAGATASRASRSRRSASAPSAGRAGRRGGADHHARGGAADVRRAVRQPGAERRQDARAGPEVEAARRAGAA